MQSVNQDIFIFAIAKFRFALPLNRVELVVRAVEVTPVPHASKNIAGIIDLHGRHIPVVQLRHRFGMAGKDLEPAHRFIISLWNDRQFALVADEVLGIKHATSLDVSPIDLRTAPEKEQQIADMGLELFEAISGPNGIVLICDLEKLLGSQVILALEEYFAQDQVKS